MKTPQIPAPRLVTVELGRGLGTYLLNSPWPATRAETGGQDFCALTDAQAESLLANPDALTFSTLEHVKKFFTLAAPYPGENQPYSSALFLTQEDEGYILGKLQALGILVPVIIRTLRLVESPTSYRSKRDIRRVFFRTTFEPISDRKEEKGVYLITDAEAAAILQAGELDAYGLRTTEKIRGLFSFHHYPEKEELRVRSTRMVTPEIVAYVLRKLQQLGIIGQENLPPPKK